MLYILASIMMAALVAILISCIVKVQEEMTVMVVPWAAMAIVAGGPLGSSNNNMATAMHKATKKVARDPEIWIRNRRWDKPPQKKRNNMQNDRRAFKLQVMSLRKKIRKADREFVMAVDRRRNISEWIDNSGLRVNVVDNKGDADSIQFGVVVDEQSRFEGWGSTPEINTKHFLAIKAKEDKIEEVERQIEDNYTSLSLVKERIIEVEKEISETVAEYGKAMPQDELRLDGLRKWAEKLEGWIKSSKGYLDYLDDSVKAIENKNKVGNDADKTEREENYNYTHWKGVHEYGERLVLKMKRTKSQYNPRQLMRMVKRVHQLRYGDKANHAGAPRMAGRQLSYKHWLELWWLLSLELYKQTNSKHWLAKVDRAKAMWYEAGFDKVKVSEVKMDPEAEVHGSASLNEDEMITAIDKMWPTKRELDLAIVFVQNRYNRTKL